MKRKYTVYRHISPEGKIYIGCTGIDPKRRWGARYNNNKELSEDISRYGWDNFTHEIIYSDLCEDDAYELEKELIHKYNTTDSKYGYNKSIGGKTNAGFHFPEESKQTLRNINIGRHHTEETKRKISEATRGEKHPMFGKHHSESSKIKMSRAHAGVTGQHHTEETKRKLSEARLGEGNPMYGKHPSEETRRKLSEARKGKTHNNYRRPEDAHRKKIMCIETGKIYESINKAAKDTGWSSSYISLVCSGKRDATGPYHWTYVG